MWRTFKNQVNTQMILVLFKENVENHLCSVLREYNADKLQD